MPRPRTGDTLVDTLLAAAHHIRTGSNERLRECGLSLARFKVLVQLEAGPRRMCEVSDALGVVPRTLTSTVDGLEEEELVRRTEHPSDRRATLLTLTARGTQRLEEARAIMAVGVRERISRLSPEQRQQLQGLLERLMED